MRRLISMMVCAVGCGARAEAPHDPPHSSVLRTIMKDEVNAPYSALAFLVFHAGDPADDRAITAHAASVQRGVAKVRALGDLPTQSDAGRAVFFTYLDSLAFDADRFSGAVVTHDRAEMAASLGRIGRTCNNCHHFFRIAVGDTTGR